jgi:small subunit ribosomal protein S4
MALGSNTAFYETPNHPYQGERIAEEAGLTGKYGLKNKEELWRAQSELRSIRREARDLLADLGESKDQEAFLSRLKRYGILGENDDLGDVLALDETDLLERRLQTIVYRSGLANTPGQARQFVAHGHVRVDGQRVREPAYTVAVAEEDDVEFDQYSPLSDELHPERAEGDR